MLLKWPLVFLLIIAVGCSGRTEPSPASGSAAPPTTPSQQSSQGTAEQASFTQGAAKTTNPGLLSCKGGRVTAQGLIQADDGTQWIVPSDVNLKLSDASDLENPCKNVHHASISAVDISKVPVTEIDPAGTVITGYLFADNYLGLYTF